MIWIDVQRLVLDFYSIWNTKRAQGGKSKTVQIARRGDAKKAIEI